MYETIKKSLEEMFDEVLVVMEKFHKKTYNDTFMNLYEKYKPVLAEIGQICASAEDAGAVLDEIASCVPMRAKETLASFSKRKKEFKMLDYNMGLVTFFTPLLAYNRNEYCLQLADQITEQWNEAFPKFKLQTSSFENIQSGFKSRLCYVTTAVCESQGKPDNCYELNLLRDYRDHYLLKEAGEEKLVQEYYNVAPTIVKHISESGESHQVYQDIWSTYLQPCIRLIEADEKEACKDIYSDMVSTLREKYLYRH